ncbi:MAG TPA: hypothetical protein VK986_00430 [Tepidisphaeraceae bacterium]|nr:hypothetical protein [Tepidisphaeraceae bacterium]
MALESLGRWGLALALLTGLTSPAIADDAKSADPKPATETAKPDPIDWDKARALRAREQRGDKLSAEEQAYLDRAKAALRAGERPNAGAGRPAPAGRNAGAPGEARASTGLVPLSDGGEAKYKNLPLGLYGDGKSDPPAAHLEKALAAAKQIVPLDADGKPDAANGRVALLSIGMSNTTQEFSKFVEIANADARKNPLVTIVDGAQGGMDAADWADPQRGPEVWRRAEQRAAALKVTPAQVQVVWIKQAIKGPQRLGDFPAHADVLQKHLATIVGLAKQRYPNLKLVYLSSRTYAGWAQSGLNPEPYAYESAFSVRGLIGQQVAGDRGLAYGDAPVLLWGPYLWTDGTKGRAADKVTWEQADTARDGTHPSDSGRRKVADMLLNFFTTDPTAKGWFLK